MFLLSRYHHSNTSSSRVETISVDGVTNILFVVMTLIGTFGAIETATRDDRHASNGLVPLLTVLSSHLAGPKLRRPRRRIKTGH